MRQACRTASDVLDRVRDLVRPGLTTKEVDEAAADFMSEARVKSAFLGYRLGHRVFPGNICISLNDEVVHGIGSQRRIQYGEIVKLDIGIIQDGWVGDNATTVPVGIIDERTDQLLRVTENALARAIKIAREGRRVGDICAEIEDEARRFSFSVVREFVGHGVGRKMHEEPQIPNYGKMRLHFIRILPGDKVMLEVFSLRFVEGANYLSPKMITRRPPRVFNFADYESTTIS